MTWYIKLGNVWVLKKMESNTNKLVLKTIHELLGEKFYIPAYQRGYRWTKLQVKELLDDIWEFSQKNGGKPSFYCLQPIVVLKKDDDQWEVVDGQQRLTTLYIILHYLEKKHLRRELKEAYKKSIFSLEYETRKSSKDFLENIDEYEGRKNKDFHHIAEAHEAVQHWFKELDYTDHNKFLATLLAKPNEQHSVQVIWYDLSDECKDNDYAIDVFSRINIGKIPLTNSELVKALFLQSSNFEQEKASLKQIQIATEWDQIEQCLQESSFWSFIYNEDIGAKYDTRIEYIFDLMQKKPLGAEDFFTFHQFNEVFKASNDEDRVLVIDRLWKSVKDYFLTFDEWYRDRELYHLIGFLIACEPSRRESNKSEPRVSKFKTQSEQNNLTKIEFKKYLKEEIKKEIKEEKKEAKGKVVKSLEELTYGDAIIRKVLLLSNIETLLSTKDTDIRFPFDRYKSENWDIEHIRSQTDKKIEGKSRLDWSEDILEYFTNTRNHQNVCLEEYPEDERSIIADLCQVLASENIDSVFFDELYNKVAEKFKESQGERGEDWTNGIGNLALLDATTNRSYKNAMFPIKRKRIIHNDKNGIFIPICTKNVFLKFYSKKLGEVRYWQKSDAEDYLEALKQLLKEYLSDTDQERKA
ncbi:DUF262 domain-containing protein [Acinetobacter haemolyticus]|nr:DUF262 domain-containing protein [Acinetobacter haemolyticus]